MSSGFFIGDRNGIAQRISQIFVGDDNGKAQKVLQGYIGDREGKAQLIFTNTIDHILIKPYARSILTISSSGQISWLSNDPATILAHAIISETSNSIIIQSRTGYQTRVYYDMSVVMTDGRIVGCEDLSDEHTITATVTDYITGYVGGGHIGYNAWMFNSDPDVALYPNIPSWTAGYTYSKQTTVTYGGTVKSFRVEAYNPNGSSETRKGCFVRMTANAWPGGAECRNQLSFDSVTIDGTSYPVTVSSDWGDR